MNVVLSLWIAKNATRKVAGVTAVVTALDEFPVDRSRYPSCRFRVTEGASSYGRRSYVTADSAVMELVDGVDTSRIH